MDTDAGEEKGCQEEGKEESKEEVAFLLYPTNDGERRGTWSPGDIHQTIRSGMTGRLPLAVDAFTNRKDGDLTMPAKKKAPAKKAKKATKKK